MDVNELRSTERYVIVEALSGSFGAASATLLDISPRGVQIEHAQPLRIATRARLWFRRGDVSVSTQANVVWSHLSKRPDDRGKLLYRSGIAFEASDAVSRAVAALFDGGAIRRDEGSLERKRELLLRRAQEKAGKPTLKILRVDNDVPHDQALLIEHARKRLAANPEEANKWYNRAKFTIKEDASVPAELMHHRQDVLAVWEYLERTVELSTVVRVFDRS